MSANIIVVLMLMTLGACKEKDSSHCPSWNNMKEHLETRGKTKCQLEATCSEISCSGLYFNYTYKMKLSVLGCEQPVTLSLYADIPKMSVHGWDMNFTTSPQFLALPGAKISGPSESYEAWVYLMYKTMGKTEIQIEELVIEGCSSSKEIQLKTREQDCPRSAPVIKGVSIKVPKCQEEKKRKKHNHSSKHDRKLDQGMQHCNASVPEQCPPDRACAENDDGISVCVCRTGTHDDNGQCVRDVPTPAPHSSSGLSRSNTAVAVVVPLILIAGVVLLVWLKRRGAFRRFRVVRVRRYEEMMIGDTDLNGEDDDDDPPLA